MSSSEVSIVMPVSTLPTEEVPSYESDGESDPLPRQPIVSLDRMSVAALGAELRNKLGSADEFLAKANQEEIAELRAPVGHQTMSSYSAELYSGHHSPYGKEKEREPTSREIMSRLEVIAQEVAALNRSQHQMMTALTALDQKVTIGGHAGSARHEELKTELHTVAESSGSLVAQIRSTEATVAAIWARIRTWGMGGPSASEPKQSPASSRATGLKPDRPVKAPKEAPVAPAQEEASTAIVKPAPATAGFACSFD